MSWHANITMSSGFNPEHKLNIVTLMSWHANITMSSGFNPEHKLL